MARLQRSNRPGNGISSKITIRLIRSVFE